MEHIRRSDSIVIQTFHKSSIPGWIQRCIDSVRSWAALQGFDYALAGDEFFDLCGRDYLARGSKNARAITNLARLVAIRQRLDAGYQQVIWMDADMFIFAPKNLKLDFRESPPATGYAFGREVWLHRDQDATFRVKLPMAHNAVALFTPAAVDLDMLISLIRHIDAKRQIVSNFQVGVSLLRGLHYSLMFPTVSHVAVFSPALLTCLADGDTAALALYARAYRYPAYAGNLCLSLFADVGDGIVWRAMDRLEESQGYIINKYATEQGVHLVAYDEYVRW